MLVRFPFSCDGSSSVLWDPWHAIPVACPLMCVSGLGAVGHLDSGHTRYLCHVIKPTFAITGLCLSLVPGDRREAASRGAAHHLCTQGSPGARQETRRCPLGVLDRWVT